MTIARAEGTTAAAAPSRDLAAALRAAGLAEVDDSPRRRAEYSSDASNYRVLPGVVAFPRHADEAAAALDVARQAGRAAHQPRRRHLHRGQRRRLRHRAGLLPAPEPGARRGPGGAHRGRRARRDPGPHHRGRGRRTGCGSARTPPPTRGPPSAARSATTPAAPRALMYGRTADNVVSLDVLTAAGERLAARRMDRDGLAAAPVAGAALDALVRARLGLIRTEFGRFTRQVSGYSLEHLLPENGADLAKFLVGSEGTLGVVTRRDGPAGAVAEGSGADGARLPGHARGRRGDVRRCCRTSRSRSRAWTRGWWRCSAPAGARSPSRTCPAAQAGCSWRPRARTEAEAQAAAKRLIADAGCLDSLVVTGAPARALWRDPRGRRRPGRPYPGGRARLARLGGRRRAARAPGRVPARFRRADDRVTAWTGCPTGTSATAACTSASTSRSPTGRGPLPDVRRRRGAAGRRVRRVDVRRARRRPGPRRAAARHVLSRGHRRRWPRSRRSSTRATCSTPA